MAQRTLLKRIATLMAGVLLSMQLAIAAHACPKGLDLATTHEATAGHHAAATMATGGTADHMPGCDGSMGAQDPASTNLCTEHCKQGQQSDRASVGLSVPPALLSVLYETPALPAPAHQPPDAARLSALVAASPPHAIAHCVLRI